MVRPDSEEIRRLAIELGPEVADAVSRWEIRVGDDWLGEPAIFVTVVFKDSQIHRAWKIRRPFRERLHDALLQRFPEYYPFIGFSAESVAINPEEPAKA